MNEFVIIGGGVASLSAAIQLANKGIKSILIEAGTYPRHKICGEFLSPESLSILENWKIIPSIKINTFNLASEKQTFSFNLPRLAGSISRNVLDESLVEIAQKNGVTVLTNTKVVALTKLSTTFEVVLSSNKTLKCSQLIIGTGRVAQLLQTDKNKKKVQFPYIGIKAHFKGVCHPKSIHFFTFPGAYAGLSAVDAKTTNIACLVRADEVKKIGTPKEFMQHIALKSYAQPLKNMIIEGEQLFEWLTCPVPNFGIHNNPDIDGVYFVGDAAGAIPPTTGAGLSLALCSGIMAAEYMIKNDSRGFSKIWRNRYKKVFRNGKILHYFMMRPTFTNIGMKLCKSFPSIARYIFRSTRIVK